MKKKITIIIAIFLLLSIFPLITTVNGFYVNWNNKNTDFSCNVDSDCEVRPFTCGCCGGGYCANKNSPNIMCKSDGYTYCDIIECEGQNTPSCVCRKNECVDKKIYDEINRD